MPSLSDAELVARLDYDVHPMVTLRGLILDILVSRYGSAYPDELERQLMRVLAGMAGERVPVKDRSRSLGGGNIDWLAMARRVRRIDARQPLDIPEPDSA